MPATLRAIAERYHLQVDGVRAWAPYWINSPNEPFWMGAPYRGKATPGQLAWAASKLAANVQAEVSAGELRVRMRDAGLGVDCSGFTYYVLDQWLQRKQERLADRLVIGCDEVLDRNARRPRLAARWGERSVSEVMSLGEACRIWESNPVYITNVQRLLDARVARRVSTAGEVQAGDMIGMSNDSGDHVGVVIEVSAGRICYMDSAMEVVGWGGVQMREIKVHDESAGLERQEWDQKGLFRPGKIGSRDGVWRIAGRGEA